MKNKNKGEGNRDMKEKRRRYWKRVERKRKWRETEQSREGRVEKGRERREASK